ncbi:MAG: MOSC domain-containing protein [Pseudomonadota bacterium]
MGLSERSTVLDLAIRAKPLAPMQTRSEAELTAAAGLVGDARGRPGKRQVTLLAKRDWEAVCRELGVELPWTLRRANILLDGHWDWPSLSARHLRIGDAVLELTIEIDPCSRMDAQQPGLTAALKPDWRGGIGARVIAPGYVTVGSEVRLLDDH